MPARLLVELGVAAALTHVVPSAVIDTEAVERRAVDAVMMAERSLGREPVEMPHFNPGYGIRSRGPDGTVRFIEVKGRIEGGSVFTVTQNELRHAGNIPNDFLLALVRVSVSGAQHDEVRYVTRPFGDELRLPFNTTSTTLQWAPYWARGAVPS